MSTIIGLIVFALDVWAIVSIWQSRADKEKKAGRRAPQGLRRAPRARG
jgi:hypothetical protein